MKTTSFHLRHSGALLVLWSLGIFPACGKPTGSQVLEAWDSRNRPEIFEANYQKKFSQLPLEAETPTPWSDTYWPSNSAGIAHRWNGTWPDNQFTFPLLTQDEVSKKSLKELASLSPAEKYDLYTGDYLYSLVNYERSRTSPDRASWEGMCHGWAPASIVFEEPRPVVLENKEGLKIPFGSSDIKALLSLLQGNFYSGPTIFLGGRCNQRLHEQPDRAQDAECRDVNAGTFHLVLTNQLGINKKAFIMDVTRDFEVWNQPVFRYQSKVLQEQAPSEGAASGTVKEIVVETEVSYGAETMALWEHLGSSGANNWNTVSYQYRLELNQEGEIIGGEWLQNQRPDFLWAQNKAEFTGFFTSLATIYEKSLAAEPGVENPVYLPDPTPSPLATEGGLQPVTDPASPAAGSSVSPAAESTETREGATSAETSPTPSSIPVINVAP